jgi:tRNA modification GTPase
VAALISSGARQARPGEFTRRAVLNGKIDVLQAEAIGDLIDARSPAMQRMAMRQLDGGLSRRLLRLREDLIALEALIAYDVDFPEEDDGPVPRQKIEKATMALLESVRNLLATASMGELIREGVIVVIAGLPNAGKSSLFNALLGSSRAIVTEIPGTTRDALEAVLEGGRWPLRLIDTAGLRATSDRIELLGIEVSERYLAQAHVVLVCGETIEDLSAAAEMISNRSDAPQIRVRTKSDLVSDSYDLPVGPFDPVAVSADAGTGLQELLSEINRVLTEKHGEVVLDSPMLTRARHRYALTSACRELEHFQQAWVGGKLPAPVAAVHLRTAVHYLEELIGAVDIEDVLERLFSTFCVGK